MADGQHIEVAKAYVTIVPSMEGSQKTIATEMGAVVEPAAKETGEKSGKHFGESLAKGLKATTAVIGAAMATATAAAVGTGKAFVSAANDVASYGDNIAKSSAKMNMSAQGYQEWSFILERSGASIEGMKTSMLKLTKAAESGDKTFQQLGISQDQLKNMSPEETWNATIAALQKVKDEGQRTALANKLLGKGATELAPLFNTTAEETEKMRQQVHELGGVMSDEAVNAAAKYQDEMTNMQTALTGVKNNMMSQFLPGISSVMSGLSKVFSGNGGVEEIRQGLQSVIQNITQMAPQFFKLASVLITELMNGFAPMLPQLVTSIFGFLQTGLMTLVTMIPQLMPVITQGIQGIASALLTCLPVLIQALIDMVSQLVTWLASGDNVKTFVDGILKLVSTLASSLSDVLPVLIPAIVNIIGQIAASLTDPKNVKMIINAVLTIIGAIVVALVKALPEIGKTIVRSTANILSTLKQWGGTVISWIGTHISNIWNKVATWFTSMPGKIAEKLATIWSKISSWFSGLPSKISGAFQATLNKMSNLGKQLVEGIAKGLKVDVLVKKVKSMGESVTKAIKKVFGIHSPSKVWRDQVGANLAKGLSLGFTDEMDDVKGDMLDSMGGLTASASISAYGAGEPLGAGTSNTYNGGAVTINVYAAQGQNVNDLANAIALKLQDMTARRGAVYA